jgi:hypothetical protein
MPTPNYSPDDALLRELVTLKNRVHALESQTNFAVRDGTGAARVQCGLLPTGDYGFQTTDPLGNTQEIITPVTSTYGGNLTTSSATMTTIANSPSVTAWIGASGDFELTISALVFPTSTDFANVNLLIDGTTAWGPVLQVNGVGAFPSVTMSRWIESGNAGLAIGSHTFALRYQSTSGSASTWQNSYLKIQPF